MIGPDASFPTVSVILPVRQEGQGFSAMTKEKCDAAKGKYEPA